MPRREVVFTGLFAFGAGVVVGANWPKASNIVGYIMNRLGFELADLAVWMWDPEKTALLNQEPQTVLPARSKKKAKVRRRRANNSIPEEILEKPKKSAPSSRKRSKATIIPATGRKRVNGRKSLQAVEPGRGRVRTGLRTANSPLSQSDRAVAKAALPKAKKSVTKNARKAPSVQGRRKTNRAPSATRLEAVARN